MIATCMLIKSFHLYSVLLWGELFDHGLDSSAAFLMPISVFSLFGHGPHSVTLWELYGIMLACLLGFLFGTLGKIQYRDFIFAMVI